MNPVLVVGDVMMDVLARHQEPIAAGTDTAARVQLAGGGSAANTACWLASGGHAVRLLAAIGDDPFGAVVGDAVRACGVELIGPVVDGASTGTCVVLVDDAGERTMLPDRGANDRLEPAAVHAALASGPSWVHVSAYTLLHEGSRSAGQAAIDGAIDAGIVVSVDVASSGPVRAVGAERFRAWIDGVDVVFANDEELAAVGGLDALLAQAGSVVVKRGSEGATWSDGDRSCSVSAPSVVAVDTTGAGDAFAAGWIAARRIGEAPEQALAAAVALGSTAATVAGARPAVTAAEVDR